MCIRDSTTINPGYNLSTANITGDGTGKYYGTAEKAENLLVLGESVPASSFLRNDVTSTSLFPLKIKNNSGIIVGADSALSIGVEGQAGIIAHQTSGSNIDVRVNDAGDIKTVIRIDSQAKVGINNLSPDQSLDVVGNIQTDSALLVEGTTEASTISTGSITTKGGVGIAKKLFVGGDTNIAGLLTTQNLVPNLTLSRNLGTSNEQWLNVYAQNFIGNLTGNITGTLATAAQTNITSLGTLTALTGGTGDLIWDTDTLVVDSSADRVGIGTTSCLLYTSPSPRDATLSRMPSWG